MLISDIFPFALNANSADLFSPTFSFHSSDLTDYDINHAQSDYTIDLDLITYQPYTENLNSDDNDFDIDIPQIDIPNTKYVTALPKPSNQFLSILSMNIVSIPKKSNYFANTVHCQFDIPFDLFTVCETRLLDKLIPLYKIPGFTAFHTCRDRSGGGVALYARSSFQRHGDVSLQEC